MQLIIFNGNNFMVHTVYLDDKYLNIKDLLKEISRHKQGVHFEYPFATDVIAREEYMTSNEFWKEADKRIIKICEQYGVFQ